MTTPAQDRDPMTITEALHRISDEAHIYRGPSVDDIEPPACGGWLRDYVSKFLWYREQAARQGIRPVCYNTGDGWVFGWMRDDEDPTESLEPLLPIDWFPVAEQHGVTSRELARLGFVEV